MITRNIDKIKRKMLENEQKMLFNKIECVKINIGSIYYYIYYSKV